MSGLAAAAGRAADDAARTWGGHAVELAQIAAELRAGWSGAAADATATELDAVARRVAGLIGDLTYLGDVLRVEGEEFEAAVSRADAVAAAPVGTEEPGEALRTRTAAAEADAALHARLSAVRAVEAIRSRLAGPALPGAAAGPLAALPDVPVDAAVLATAWHRLGPAERDTWAAAHPGLEDRAGLPAAARDSLNRAELARLVGPQAGAPGVERGPHTEERARALAEHLRAHPDSRVLTLDGDGRGAVASGDPADAERVVTLVPGTHSSMASVDAHAAEAAALCEATDAADPETESPVHGVSPCVSVAWMDQDAPEHLLRAAFDTDRATDAADDLQEFQRGLRVLGPAGLGVVGYSYGGVVVGTAAAADGGLAADSVVFLASPGATVDHVSGLTLVDVDGLAHPGDAGSVAAVAERWDAVPWWSVSGVHGDSPHEAGFGADLRPVDTVPFLAGPVAAHTRYFDPGAVSLSEIGAALGRAPAARPAA